MSPSAPLPYPGKAFFHIAPYFPSTSRLSLSVAFLSLLPVVAQLFCRHLPVGAGAGGGIFHTALVSECGCNGVGRGTGRPLDKGWTEPLGSKKKTVRPGMAGTASGCLLPDHCFASVACSGGCQPAVRSLGITVPGFVPVVGELFPRHGEVLYGFMAATASICSSIVVALTGIVLDKTGSYNAVFMLLAVLCTLGIALFQSYASVTPILPEDREPADPVV